MTEREWQVPSPSFLIMFIGYPHPSAAEGLDLPSLPTFSTTEEPHALISAERESRERNMKSERGRKKDSERESPLTLLLYNCTAID